MAHKPLFVTGIGTGIGKTVISSLLCEQLKCDYWKPVQSGDLDHSDSMTVKKLVSNQLTNIHPERFRLKLAASPHQSSLTEGIEIVAGDFKLPATNNQLLIEGAGGLFVPLSPTFLMTDLILQSDAEVILVVRDYLGCINHTLLSLYAISGLQIPLKHVVFNGKFNPESQRVLIQHLPKDVGWTQVSEFENINAENIRNFKTQIAIY